MGKPRLEEFDEQSGLGRVIRAKGEERVQAIEDFLERGGPEIRRQYRQAYAHIQQIARDTERYHGKVDDILNAMTDKGYFLFGKDNQTAQWHIACYAARGEIMGLNDWMKKQGIGKIHNIPCSQYPRTPRDRKRYRNNNKSNRRYRGSI